MKFSNSMVLSFGALAVLASSAYAADGKNKKNAASPEAKKDAAFCEKAADPSKSGCNTADSCASAEPTRLDAKNAADCKTQGGTWKTPATKEK
jgi:hypothetical protein